MQDLVNSSPTLREIAQKFKHKLEKIKVLAFDIDGVLTDGTICYDGAEMGWNRTFYVQDGYGLKMMMQAGFKIAIISGGSSVAVKERFEKLLPVDYFFVGNEDKRQAYNTILNDGFTDQEILYIGDEFFDLPLLKRAGFSATTPEASLEIQEAVDYVTVRSAGRGCAREIIDMLRYTIGFTPKIADF